MFEFRSKNDRYACFLFVFHNFPKDNTTSEQKNKNPISISLMIVCSSDLWTIFFWASSIKLSHTKQPYTQGDAHMARQMILTAIQSDFLCQT